MNLDLGSSCVIGDKLTDLEAESASGLSHHPCPHRLWGVP